jgi:adenylate cyclase
VDGIHLSEAVHERLEGRFRFRFQDQGLVTVKGKGHMRTYLLLGTA